MVWEIINLIYLEILEFVLDNLRHHLGLMDGVCLIVTYKAL